MRREKILTFGCVRNDYKSKLFPDELIQMISLWFRLCDKIDTKSKSKSVTVTQTRNYQYISYTSSDVLSLSGTVYGTDIIKKGQIKTWEFKLTKVMKKVPLIMIGIVLSSKASFNNEYRFFFDGYGLYTRNGYLYSKIEHPDKNKKYLLSKFKETDKLIMKLDLTLKKELGSTKCGTLTYFLNDGLHSFYCDDNMIAYNNIDINESYKLGICVCNTRDEIALRIH